MEKSKVNKLKEDFENLVKISSDKGYYCDINFLSKKETRASKDKVNCEIGKDNDSGVKIRIWDNEKFLEGATSSTNINELKNVLNGLLDSADKNQEHIEKKIELKLDREEVKKDFLPEVKISENKLEEKVDIMNGLKDDILSIDEKIVNSRVILVEKYEEHLFVNEYKTLYQEVPLSILVLVGFVNCDDGSTRMVYEPYVNSSFDQCLEKAKKNFNKVKEKAHSMMKAKKLEGGKYKVLLSPMLTGLLAHESFGHGMEADTMMRDRALATEWAGKKIGKDNVNIIDYSAIEGKHGEFYFDHEGNLARKTYLVKNGVINEPMADLYSKSRMDLDKSNNSRMEAFDHKHYTRMSNTYFEAGDKSFDELLEGIEDGIFVTDSSGGMEDPKGWGVQIQGNFGQRIKNGKLVDEFYDGFTLTGFLPDIVKNISGLSKEFDIDGGGHCGKGHKEWVRVSEGGPFMVIDEVILG